MRTVFLVTIMLSMSFGCITRFDVDAGVDGGSAADVPSSVDANSANDAAATTADAGARDHNSASDLASQADQAQPDTASTADHNNNPVDAAGQDTASQDSGSQTDSATVVPDGGMPLGAHCENAPCGDGMMCIGNSNEAYCRLSCARGGSDCDPNSEYCISINLADGGTAATGACVPAGGENAPCDDDPCAEVYFCAYMGDDAAASTCRIVCDPGVAEGLDAGCPSAQNCYNINGFDGGACL